MIRHILMFSLNEEVPGDVRQNMLDDLARFPEQFEQICDWEMGVNVSDRDDTYDHCATMTFAGPKEMAAYLGSEEHERFVRERFRPVISKRAIVSFEVAPTE